MLCARKHPAGYNATLFLFRFLLSRSFFSKKKSLGISQRDPNYYDFWNEPSIRESVTVAATRFWDANIKSKWDSGSDCKFLLLPLRSLADPLRYKDTFDLLLTRDLSSAHIIDFNPYAPRTDPLLFTYEELHALLTANRACAPMLKVVNSRAHSAAARNAPLHQHNMVPVEAFRTEIQKSQHD